MKGLWVVGLAVGLWVVGCVIGCVVGCCVTSGVKVVCAVVTGTIVAISGETVVSSTVVGSVAVRANGKRAREFAQNLDFELSDSRQ